MKKLLFVDDDTNVLDGLRRMLFSMRREWDMEFVNSGVKALEMIAQSHFDVVVTDMRMPGMDGATLLGEIKRTSPKSLRFILSGQSDSEIVYRSVGDAHQFLSKPCRPEVLKDSIERVLQLESLLANEALRTMVGRIGVLPPRPKVYTELCEELQSSEGAIGRVGEIIEGDLALTAKILQLANSAFFGLRQHISTASQAASFLGFDTIKALILVTGLFDHMENRALSPHLSLDWLWRHGITVGAAASAICQAEKMPLSTQCDAYTSGLLHDAGMLILASSCKDEYASVTDRAQSERILLTDAESAAMACTHAEIGAYLLGIWGLPTPIVEAVAYHHRPSACAGRDFSPLTAVHLADVLTTMHDAHQKYPLPLLDYPYLERLGMINRIGDWKRACEPICRHKDI